MTVTLARSKEEEVILRTTLGRLMKLDLPVIAADGGSPDGFVEGLKNMGVEVVRPWRQGLVPQVKAAVKAAEEKGSHTDILYTEPDKLPFFEQNLRKLVDGHKPERSGGLVFAARDKQSFATFPPAQRHCEEAMNHTTSLLIGQSGDFCYGPLIFGKESVRHVADAPDYFGWGWRFFLLGRMVREGMNIVNAEMKLPCPPEQRSETHKDRLYRAQQLQQNLQGLVAGLADR